MTPPEAQQTMTLEYGEVERGQFLNRMLLQREFALSAVTIGLFAFFSIYAEHFFGLPNVYDIARVSTYTLIVGVPTTYLFIAGEFDLSIGPNFALCNVCMALAIVNLDLNTWVAAGLAILLGTAIGAVNGFVTTVIGVPSFIVTLGMLSVLSGLALVLTAGAAVDYPDGLESSFFTVTNGVIGPLSNLPVSVLWGLGAVLVGAWVLRYTRFGYHVYATGGNVKAARAAGISARGVKFTCFVLTGASCGMVGALQGGWLRQGDPITGSDFTLLVVAAVIIGGVALTGGEGSVYGTLLGAWIIGMLYNGLILLGVQSHWNQFFVGLIIVLVASGELALKRKNDLRDSLRNAQRRLSRLILRPAGKRRRPSDRHGERRSG